jgi:hypothetical protein
MADTAVMGGPLYVHAGNDGAELGPFGSLGFLLQNLTTTPGASYVVSCWLDSPDGEAPNEFLVSWNGTNIFDQVNMVETGWTNLQFVVTASSTNTPLEFGFRNDNSYFGLDAITVNNLLPIPGALASFATGGGGIQVSNGTFVVALMNPSGQGPVVVQASTDLAHWTPVFTNASPGSSFQFTDSAPANMPCRYYRAVVGTSP